MFELEKRAIGLDDIADVRYLHSSAFRVSGAEYHTEEQINAYLDRINSTDYIQECMNCSLYGVWHNHILIGTEGWCPSNDNRSTARIRKIYVHNFYLGLGLGRNLVENAEQRAKGAGFKEFSIRTSATSCKFFKAIGYNVSSHGALSLANDKDIPVIYMRKNQNLNRENKKPSQNNNYTKPSSDIKIML